MTSTFLKKSLSQKESIKNWPQFIPFNTFSKDLYYGISAYQPYGLSVSLLYGSQSKSTEAESFLWGADNEEK